MEAMGIEFRKSLKNSYRQLLEPSRNYPNALGWLCAEVNRNDLREQFLKLTPRGERVIADALEEQARQVVSR